jgi:general secretion pathway protein K
MSGRITAKTGSDGMALVLALFAVVVLTALAFTFASVARTDVLLSGNRAAMTQAFYAAQSSLNYCRTVLAADDPALDSTGEDWALLQHNPPTMDIPGFTVGAVIEDESGRLNVNTADKIMLMALPGMTEEAADSILDWRDGDDNPRPLGAESDYYLSLPSPYQAGNGPFQTIDELRLVRGVDATLFDGDGTKANPGLANLVTVRSGESNMDAQGRRRLNINIAPSAQLAARLGDILTDQDLLAVQRRRNQGPLRSLAEVMSIAGVSWRKLALTLDRVRVDDSDFVEGRVNLNTASESVLEAIGLPPAAAQALIAQRASALLATKGDLASVAGVTRETMTAVADRISTKSSIFGVRAFAQANDRPIRAGVFALLDRRAQPPRVIAWREDPNPPLASNAVEEQGNAP